MACQPSAPKVCLPCTPMPNCVHVTPDPPFYPPDGFGFGGGPPPLDPTIALTCVDNTRTGVTITTRSPYARFRFADVISNRRYRAREFTFRADTAGHYTVTVTPSGFSPFITVARSVGERWQNTGSTLEFDVTSAQTGPMTLEVSTVSPYETGEFGVILGCPTIKLISYWKFDETSGVRIDSKGTNHLTPTVGNVGFITGKLGNAVQLGAATPVSPFVLDPSTTLQPGVKGFTLAGWFKYKDSASFAPAFVLSMRDASNVILAQIAISTASFLGLTCQISQAIGGLKTLTQFGVTTLDTFCFFRSWVNFENSKIGLHVDANAKYEFDLGFTWGPGVIDHVDLRINGQVGGDLTTHWSAWDELGFWDGPITDDDYDYLRNSSTGRTFPDVPYA